MIIEILQQLNWVDFLVIIIFLRIVFMAVSSGFALELFKLLGTLTSFYLSLHYFTFFTDWLDRRTPLAREKVPLQFMDFISLLAIAALGYLIFVALRLVLDRFIKMEVNPAINRSVGLLLGIVRGGLLVCFVAFVMVVSSIGYLKDSVKDSYSGKRCFNGAVQAYSWMWNNVTSKFSLGENFNKTVLEVQKDLHS